MPRRSASPSLAPSRSGSHVRCAIYTRKSTEEGLDQDFNSLDAQYEACAAYIASQRHEGWSLLPGRYDDGGFSGGNMDRPGLQRLLADVKSGRIDVIVVYKVDRLTRSLTDFAKIVEALDGAGASFVSITQSFNTTTSMGRLTLNVLLSFAQFEREVIAERVRDKVAASRAKGMWMGGSVPLGYDVRDRKLVVNKAEAEQVRCLFRRYLELGSIRDLLDELTRKLIRSRRDKAFSRGALNYLLKNRVYRGEAVHRGVAYPGEHAAIIDADLFEAVQQLLARNATEQATGARAAAPSLLAGMLRDEHDRPMSPTQTNKAGRRYRYYASNLNRADAREMRPMRVAASELESVVIIAAAQLLRSGEPIHALAAMIPAGRLQAGMRKSAAMAVDLEGGAIPNQRAMLQAFDVRLLLSGNKLSGSLSRPALMRACGIDAGEEDERIDLGIETRIVRCGTEMRMLFEAPGQVAPRRDKSLIGLLERAERAREKLVANDADCADPDRKRELTRVARLSYLAPDIVSAIVEGRQPDDLGARRLLRMSELPLSWSDQRKLLSG